MMIDNGAALSRFELWSLREDVSVEPEPGDGPVRLHGRGGEVTIERPPPLVREALLRMRLGPVSLGNAFSAREAPAERAALFDVLETLQPLVVRSLGLESGQPLLSVVPLTGRARFRPVRLAADVPLRLSTFAELRTDGSEYHLESPLALHRVVLHRPEAVELIAHLAAPTTPAAFTAALATVAPSGVAAALAYLAGAGMVVRAQAPPSHPPVFAEDTDPALIGWSPTDLMFHTRSTLGRHDRDFGITYPTGETVSPEPVVKPQADRYVPLHQPRWEDMCAADPPLCAAVEGRRTMRRHAADPITVAQLGDLLYRTARVRSVLAVAPGGQGGPQAPRGGDELSDRPYPSHGGCYELELYVTAGDCTGLPRGIYHYDPLGHRLEPVSADRAIVSGQLNAARVPTAMDGQPPVLITMTARFRRLSWKYEGMAFRLVLMHAGALIQNLYLVCTAMGLAPCAVGAVCQDTTARGFGTDWRVEPSIAQFIVGAEPAARDQDPDGRPEGSDGTWRDVNDAQWAGLGRARRRRG